jgi:hypothetical protein
MASRSPLDRINPHQEQAGCKHGSDLKIPSQQD